MSIAVMSAVWKQSTHKGNALLLILAIADNAADDGYAWPGTRYLAKKIRASRQTVIRLMKTLEESGELYVVHSRRIGNKYIVLTGFNCAEIGRTLEKRFDYKTEIISNILLRNKMLLLKSQNVTSEVTPMLPEPSRTINEPSLTARAENKNPSPAAEEIPDPQPQSQHQGETQQDWEAGFKQPTETIPARTAESYRDELVTTEARALARRREQPWATWGEHSKEARAQLARRDGMAQSLRRLGYELDTMLGLRPVWARKKSVASWFVGLANCLEEADGDVDLVLEAANHLREQEMTLSSPHSLVKTTSALAAKRRSSNRGTITIGL